MIPESEADNGQDKQSVGAEGWIMLTLISGIWTVLVGLYGFHLSRTGTVQEVIFFSTLMLIMFLTTMFNAHKGV